MSKQDDDFDDIYGDAEPANDDVDFLLEDTAPKADAEEEDIYGTLYGDTSAVTNDLGAAKSSGPTSNILDEDDDDDDDDDDEIELVLNPAGASSSSTAATSGHATSTGASAGGSSSKTNIRSSTQHLTLDLRQSGSGANAIDVQQKDQTKQPPQRSATDASNAPVFELDIDALEEKPWRRPGVALSDYFNFGFNEDTWRAYCQKQVELRLENENRGKIAVYRPPVAQQQPPPPRSSDSHGSSRREPPPRDDRSRGTRRRREGEREPEERPAKHRRR